MGGWIWERNGALVVEDGDGAMRRVDRRRRNAIAHAIAHGEFYPYGEWCGHIATGWYVAGGWERDADGGIIATPGTLNGEWVLPDAMLRAFGLPDGAMPYTHGVPVRTGMAGGATL